MNIPLDRLYHCIEHIAQEIQGNRILIYRFWPHGSKKIDDLTPLYDDYTWEELLSWPAIYCNDQEPLNFKMYENPENPLRELLAKYDCLPKPDIQKYPNIYDQTILLHSEKRSGQVEKFHQNYFIPVYYWSHAIIAKDWFRYAEHVTFKKQSHKTFLIYNRAWAGTREYRLKFSEFLIRLGLVDQCQTSVNPIEPELNIHYEQHEFINPVWRPTQIVEDHFTISNAHSHYSADFDINDYNSTDIEVVLETLFDDTRLHLTEKSLRPIACAQPFILAGTHGSLEYLRHYGFKTFGHIWDESYDLIEDPEERLIRIVDLMQQIANWTPEVRTSKLAEAQSVAEYNRQHFFSQEFIGQVVQELHNNLKPALDLLEDTNTSVRFLDYMNKVFQHKELTDIITGKAENPMLQYMPPDAKNRIDLFNPEALTRIMERARQYYLRNSSTINN